MTEKIKGKITGKEISEGANDAGEPWTRASFTINDRKYASFDTKVIEEFNTGDYVEAEFNTSKDGKYKNIVKMTEATAPEPKEIADISKVWENKDKRMAKMNGINNAVLIIGIMGQVMPESTKLMLERTPALDLAKEFAEQIVKYIYTD
jgi:hypothetical protein